MTNFLSLSFLLSTFPVKYKNAANIYSSRGEILVEAFSSKANKSRERNKIFSGLTLPANCENRKSLSFRVVQILMRSVRLADN